jgi:uncharacterized protein (UPF0276 family)
MTGSREAAVPLIAASWDITSEHEKLEPYAGEVAADAFLIGPYAWDMQSVDKGLKFCKDYGLTPLLHTLDLDLCGLDPLNEALVANLGAIARRLQVGWVTTDLAMWMRDDEALVEALVPMPWTEDAIDYIVPRVTRVQEILGLPVALENSSYAYVVGDANPFEIQCAIAKATDSLMVFDVGHYLIASVTSGVDLDSLLPRDFLWERVVEGHISGVTILSARDGVIADDQHATPISEQLWELAAATMPRARQLRYMVAESEGISGPDLVGKVRRMRAEVARWQ